MKIKRIIDISKKIHPRMVTWPGDSGVSFKRNLQISNGDNCNVSSVNMGLHSGTHIDAPLHFIDKAKDISSLDLSRFLGFVKVFELASQKCITFDDIKDLQINEGDIVFFKTSNSQLPEGTAFYEDFIYIHSFAAEYLVEKKIKTLGVDYLSIDSYHAETAPAHKMLLSNNIGIIESLCLSAVDEGTYFFSCLPLCIEGADGSPARAVLIEFET